MPRVYQSPETLDTTFTWSLMLEAGMGPIELFGHLPPREPQNPDWYREAKWGTSGGLVNDHPMILALIAISRDTQAPATPGPGSAAHRR